MLGLVFGLGGYLLYRVASRKLDWDIKSIGGAFKWAFLAWGLYEIFIFARFFIEYVIQAPLYYLSLYQTVTLSLTSRVTENPFIFGLNPLGYFVISPLQAIVTWCLELGGAFLILYVLGPILDSWSGA